MFGTHENEIYEMLSLKYDHLQSAHEVMKWYEDNNFKEVVFTNCPVNRRNPIKKFFSGEYGGYLMVRGVKNDSTKPIHKSIKV